MSTPCLRLSLLGALFTLGACGSKTEGAGSASSESKPTATASSTASSVAKDDSISFVKRPAAVGDKLTRSKTFNNETSGEVKGKKKAVRADASAEWTEECLEAKEGTCIKLKVVYTKFDVSGEEDGRVDKPKFTLAGNAYEVEIKDPEKGVVNVKRADGKPPAPLDGDALRKAYKGWVSQDKLRDKLPDGPTRVGDSLDGYAKAFADLAATESGLEKPTAKGTGKVKAIKEVDGKKVAVFDMSISLEGDMPRIGHFKLSISSDLEVRADCGCIVGGDTTSTMDVEYVSKGGQTTTKGSEKLSTKPSF